MTFQKRRTYLLVSIEQDPVPGWGNVPEDHQKHVQQILEGTIGWYNPTVEIMRCEEKRHLPTHTRGCDAADTIYLPSWKELS